MGILLPAPGHREVSHQTSEGLFKGERTGSSVPCKIKRCEVPGPAFCRVMEVGGWAEAGIHHFTKAWAGLAEGFI